MKVKFGNKVRVGDPCYEPDKVAAGAYTEIPAVAGEWDIEVEDESNPIDRVFLRDCARTPVAFFGTFALGVDAGQMAFESVEVQRGGEYGEAGYYGDACRTTLTDGCGVFQSGGHDVFVTSTGFGDGVYDLVVGFNEAGQAVSMEMRFIEEENDVCDYCGESSEWCHCDEEDEAEDEE